MTPIDFGTAFKALTENDPFPWQIALYERFISDRPDNIPKACNLPTGLGKTSVIAVWLIALANHPDKMPRRLVYVVNRRTVVDQTTDEVVKYRRNLSAAGITEPLAISTLRGQFADNREWSADPSRPAVICGTVDMIGSRLLFSGYGCGFKTRPLHAGFLGQDSLLVHDEAHLEPAFQDLLVAIEKEQTRCNDFRPMRVMELTATSRGDGEVFTLTPDDHANDTVKRRINATKKLHLHDADKQSADDIVKYAKALTEGERSKDRAILIFAREVKLVEEIVKKLPKGQVQQLTGTLRGDERDKMADPRRADGCPIFARFLPPPKDDAPESERWKVDLQKGTVYLVCTSAGEVGVNISADHLVCDLSTFESMAQRFGRVNRFGLLTDTEIHVIHPKEFDDDKPPERQMRNTLALLHELNGDASPAALGKLDASMRLAAFAPPPTILPTSDILFDSWALTTINRPLVKEPLPGRPHVEPYLHGIAGWQPPDTHVAWREEVGVIVGDLLDHYQPEELLDQYPLKPHELLGDNSGRVFDRLKKLKADPGTPVWLVLDDDSVEVTTLGDLIAAGRERIEHETVLLPPTAGGLENGFLTSDSPHADDVADEWRNEHGERRRVRVWDDDAVPEGIRRICTLDTNPDADETDEAVGKRFWHWFELPRGGDTEGSKSNQKPVLWQVHTDDVVRNSLAIVEKLLPEWVPVFKLVAELHDLGKKRKLFQTVLGNHSYPAVVLAKSGKNGGRIEEKYRHEFGSLIDIQAQAEFQKLTPDDQSLVLHLIATHHGRGRPHFPLDEVFDPERSTADAEKVARETPQRFARLQRKYGRWGLAYLESLLRAADYAASANPSEFVKEDAP